MTEGPYPEVPRIAPPVSGVTRVGVVTGERKKGRDLHRKLSGPPQDVGPDSDVDAPVEHPLPPPDPLIEALDRLRATHGESEAAQSGETVAPADAEVLRWLRARKLYPAAPQD